MKVEWRIDGIFNADPGKVYAEINSLGENFTPKDVVELARDESTEAHKCFTWDDAKAADKYREIEAGKIVRSLVVKSTTSDGELVNIRLVENTGIGKGYTPTRVIVHRTQDYTDLLARALAELRAFKQKYKTVSELCELFDMIDGLTA